MKLKNCPFCGGEAKMQKLGNYGYVRCTNGKCTIKPMTPGYLDNDRAVREWNQRHDEKEKIRGKEND